LRNEALHERIQQLERILNRDGDRVSKVLRGKRVGNRRAGGRVRHIKIDHCAVVGHLGINIGEIDEHRHARPRQVCDLLVVRQIRASAHSRRAGAFTPGILHFDIHEQRVAQLDIHDIQHQ
jgi:hypothetical protein